MQYQISSIGSREREIVTTDDDIIHLRGDISAEATSGNQGTRYKLPSCQAGLCEYRKLIQDHIVFDSAAMW